MMELDEKFADVIVNRYREKAGSDADIKGIRDGKEHSWQEVQVTSEAGE